MRVVTVGMDRMDFHVPIYVGELVTFRATVNAAWRSSMEVGSASRREPGDRQLPPHQHRLSDDGGAGRRGSAAPGSRRSSQARPSRPGGCARPSCAAPTGSPSGERSSPGGPRRTASSAGEAPGARETTRPPGGTVRPGNRREEPSVVYRLAVARHEAACAGHQRPPARTGSRRRVGIVLGRRVQADAGDLDERVTRIGVDGDPLAERRVRPQLSNSLESIDTLSRPAACST